MLQARKAIIIDNRVADGNQYACTWVCMEADIQGDFMCYFIAHKFSVHLPRDMHDYDEYLRLAIKCTCITCMPALSLNQAVPYPSVIEQMA